LTGVASACWRVIQSRNQGEPRSMTTQIKATITNSVNTIISGALLLGRFFQYADTSES
jgi:hypothetical protein